MDVADVIAVVAPAGLNQALPVGWLALLDDAERERARLFVDELDRRRFVASRCLLRTLLGRIFAQDPGSFRFLRSPAGAWSVRDDSVPWIPGLTSAHAAGAVAVAVARAQAVGVDIEGAAAGEAWVRSEALAKMSGRAVDDVAGVAGCITQRRVVVGGQAYEFALASQNTSSHRVEIWRTPQSPV